MKSFGLPVHKFGKAFAFVLLSGFGWCLDMSLFYGLVHILKLGPGIANMASATTAAMIVFLITRSLIFNSRHNGKNSIAVYFFYIEINILLSATGIEWLAQHLSSAYEVAPTSAAITSKVLITPASLICNFLVTRWLSGSKKYE